MQYKNVCIAGMGYVIPDNVITSAWLEEQIAPVYEALHVPMGFIERVTGIKEHRWWDEGVSVSDASAMAAERAIERAGIDKARLQCLINASVCRDYIEPATASIVHHKVGLPPEAMSFDMVNACLGFLSGMMTIANMIELGQIDAGIVTAAEAPREGQLSTIAQMLSDPPTRDSLRDNLASFTLGAASVAMVLRRCDQVANGHRVLGGAGSSNTEHNDLCVAQRTWMHTNSSKLLREGTVVIRAAWKKFKAELGWRNRDVDRLFSHQVSMPQRLVGLRALGISPQIDYPTVHYLGNTASVAAPLSMALGADDDFVRPGEKVVLFGVGSGINSLIMGIEW